MSMSPSRSASPVTTEWTPAAVSDDDALLEVGKGAALVFIPGDGVVQLAPGHHIHVAVAVDVAGVDMARPCQVTG